MKISWIKFLTILNCPITNTDIEALQPCPFHPNTEPSLRIHSSDHTLYFTCCRDNCKFKGDPITMAAQCLNLPFPDAIALFKPGHRFYSTLIDETFNTHQVEYTNPHINQDIIQQFMAQCRHALMTGSNEHVALINDFLVSQRWTHSSLQHIHDDMGYLHSQDIPEQLEVMDTKAYKFDPHIIFGQRYDGRIIGFQMFNIKSGTYTSHKLLTEKNYIFMPQNIGADTKLYVAPNELVAFAIYSKAKTYSTIPFPVISMSNAMLPNMFKNVKEITFINTKKAPLTITKALEIFKHKQLIEGTITAPRINVLSIACEVTDKPLNEFLHAHAYNKQPLMTWIAKDIMQLYNSGITSRLFDLLNTHKLSPDKFSELVNALINQNAPDDFITDITDYNLKTGDEMFLSNGNTVRKTRGGMIGRTADHDKVILSNVVFDIHKKYITNDNNAVCDCTLSVNDHTIRTTLDHNIFSKTTLLKNAVNTAFMNSGIAPKMAIYGVRGFQWDEIRDIITESSTVEKEIKHLGLTDIHTLDFTNCRISNTVESQSKIFTINKAAQAMYAGLNLYTSDTGIKPFESLWRNTDATSLALSAVISQIIHCIMSGVDLLANGNIQPNHLLLLRSPMNTLDILFTQLLLFCSGTENINRLPYVNPLKFLQGIQELGSLPFISLLPKFNIDRQIALLGESPVNIITTIPEEESGMFGELKNISFLASESKAIYHTKSIMELRQSFPYFMQRLLRSEMNLVGQYPTPSIYVYENIAEYFNIKPAKLDKLIKPYFISAVTSMDNLFFNDVRTLVQESSIKIRYDVIPTVEDDKGVIYVTDTCAYLPRKIVGMLNQKLHKKYKAEAVEYHLTENKIIENTDIYFWIINKEMWDRQVGRVVTTVMLNNGPFKLLALTS